MIFRARNVVFLLSIAAFVFADEPNKDITTGTPSSTIPVVKSDPQPPPTSTTPPPTTPTTPAPTTPPTTPVPTTKPTTPVPTTKPTTPVPTTSSTTPAPTTKSTTPAPAPTTPAPAPPKNENWIVTGPNGTVCIVARMIIKINVDYTSSENKSVEITFSVNNVQNASATGTCTEPNAESLVLKWNNVTATFNFNLNATAKTYSLDSVNITIAVNNQTFPNNTMVNVTEVQLSHKGQLFSVSTNNSYSCADVKPLALNGTIPSTNTTLNGKLTITGVKVQAFGIEKTDKYREALDCVSGETPDIVPIVVGLVLAGLVVVVLVAYLVGRRRAQSRGYLSM